MQTAGQTGRWQVVSAKAGARPDRSGMQAGGRSGRPAPVQPEGALRVEPPREPRQSALALTLVLALLLLVVAAGAYEASELLRQAVRPLAPNDLAALTCTAFTTQNYGLLTAQIDPTPVAPTASGPFNSQQVVNRLAQLDTALGKVSKCGYSPVGATGSASAATRQQFVLEMWRAHAPTIPSGVTLIVRKAATGRWMISRESSFLTTTALGGVVPGRTYLAVYDSTFIAALEAVRRVQI